MKSAEEEISELTKEAIALRGHQRVALALHSLIKESETKILTIIANQGSHKIPDQYLRGDVYIASRGNLDFSSASAIRTDFLVVLRELRKKLQERSWNKIFLIPTGHPALSIQLKMCVYRTSRINTTDVFYYNGEYFDIDIDIRKIDDSVEG